MNDLACNQMQESSSVEKIIVLRKDISGIGIEAVLGPHDGEKADQLVTYYLR